MEHDNAKTLKDGFAKGLKMIEDTIFESLWNSGVAILKFLGDIHPLQGWEGFTGNTQTSYACGIYMDGSLEGIITQDNWHDTPRRLKVRKGEAAYLKNPYEGSPRAVKGSVDVSSDTGLETSIGFLQTYKAPKGKVSIVVTTGTEYSEYIESVRKLDVLTRTYMEAPRLINANWKKIPD